MSNITRFDPFAADPMSDLFHGLFRPLRGGAGGEMQLADIKVDVTEGDTQYTVKAELPGVEKDDIDMKKWTAISYRSAPRSSANMS